MIFSKEMYNKIEEGKEIKCFEKECCGVIVRGRVEIEEQFCELDENKKINYFCSVDPMHNWVYEHSLFNII